MFILKADKRLQGVQRSKAETPTLMNLVGLYIWRTVGPSSWSTPGLIKQLLRWGRTVIQYEDFEAGPDFRLVHALCKTNECLCWILYSLSIAKTFLVELFQSSGLSTESSTARNILHWGHSWKTRRQSWPFWGDDFSRERGSSLWWNLPSPSDSCGVICSVQAPVSPVLTDGQGSQWYDVPSSRRSVLSRAQTQLSASLPGVHKLSLLFSLAWTSCNTFCSPQLKVLTYALKILPWNSYPLWPWLPLLHNAINKLSVKLNNTSKIFIFVYGTSESQNF